MEQKINKVRVKDKVSLITTVRNEEEAIKKFLDSVSIQTKKPDEIIIVDAFSTDDTVDIIKSYPLKIKLFQKKGNRSIGRNKAIAESSNSIIAVSDVGCILDKNWLTLITAPLKNSHLDVVGGFYKPKTYSIFEKSLSTYTCTMHDKLNRDSFLPSSRSVAFRKSAWEKVGGYPEHLDTCEDLVFDRSLKQKGFKFITEERAIVYWPQRKNIYEAFLQFFSYAKGDGEAHYFRKSTPFLIVRYIIGILSILFIILTASYQYLAILIPIGFSYMLWAIHKNYKYVANIHAIIYLPLLQLTSDVAVITGMSIGILNSSWKKFLK